MRLMAITGSGAVVRVDLERWAAERNTRSREIHDRYRVPAMLGEYVPEEWTAESFIEYVWKHGTPGPSAPSDNWYPLVVGHGESVLNSRHVAQFFVEP